MKGKIKVVLSVVLSLIVVISAIVPASASIHVPRATIIIGQNYEGIAAGETVNCLLNVYSENGFNYNFRLSELDFEYRGSAKVRFSDFETFICSDKQFQVKFKITGVYPGTGKVHLKPYTFCDKAGIENGSTTIPRKLDVKIFNTEGEKAHEQMSTPETWLTLFVAPFWGLLDKVGMV